MFEKIYQNTRVFIAVSIIISVISSIYYYNKVAQRGPNSRGTICYSDFRVFWLAGYNLKHHIIRKKTAMHKDGYGYRVFSHFWFLNPKLRHEKPYAITNVEAYKLYDKTIEFYHFRYSPFIAFLMIPFGKFVYQTHALMLWYFILNASFLGLIFILKQLFSALLPLPARRHQHIILWATYLGCLRFYLTNISLGQTDILIALFFTLAALAYADKKNILCGVTLALIFHIKPLFLPVLLYFLLTGKKKIVLATILSFIILAFIPSYMLGISKTLALSRDWINILQHSVSSQLLHPKNQSLSAFIANILYRIPFIKTSISPAYLFSTTGITLALACLAGMAWLRKLIGNTGTRKYKLLEMSLVMIISLIASPITWRAHFTVLALPIAYAVYVLVTNSDRQKFYIYFGAFFVMSCLVGTDILKITPHAGGICFPIMSFGALFLAWGLISGYMKAPVPARNDTDKTTE